MIEKLSRMCVTGDVDWRIPKITLPVKKDRVFMIENKLKYNLSRIMKSVEIKRPKNNEHIKRFEDENILTRLSVLTGNYYKTVIDENLPCYYIPKYLKNKLSSNNQNKLRSNTPEEENVEGLNIEEMDGL